MGNLIPSEQERSHWEYFIVLESDVILLSRYIALSRNNEHTHSIELARLLMVSASECDTLLKQICKKFDPGFKSKAAKIDSYRKALNIHLSNLHEVEISLRGHDWKLMPWKDFNNNSPSWWTACNKIKHQRTANFPEANLGNAIAAIAALFVLNLIYYRLSEVTWIIPPPKLFRSPAMAQDDVCTLGPFLSIEDLGINAGILKLSLNEKFPNSFF